ncbi:PAS domain-containing protein [Streptomyces massasporeus]
MAVATREDRLVWVGSQEEMARSYPRTAVVLPYPMALAAAQVTGIRRWGVLLLMWPATRPPYMTGRERGHIMAGCRRLARLLEEAAERGSPPSSGDEQMRVVSIALADRSGSRAMAAADFAERLPGGSCALNLEGQVTFVSSGACDLLDCEADRLLGTVPWQSLRWLDDPTYEDRYRERCSVASPSPSPPVVHRTSGWSSTSTRMPAGSASASSPVVRSLHRLRRRVTPRARSHRPARAGSTSSPTWPPD